MEGCWDPEFEPSIEEIVDYRRDMVILSVRFLRGARSLEGFPYSVEHMAGGGHIWVNRLKPRAPIIYAYTEHAQFVDVAEVDIKWRRTVGAVNTFYEGRGM